ncbi:MAG: RNA-binding domain-containing protein [Phycisphaerales bacterium]
MIETLEQLVACLRAGTLREHRESNVEVKKSWEQEHGKKISAFANRPSGPVCWMCVGVSDDGQLSGRDESWVKKTEERISQQLNQYLDPQNACLGLSCHECDGQWFIAVKYANPGSVVRWNNVAYKAAGTTINEMTPEDTMALAVALPGLSDYSSQKWSGSYDCAMAIDFVRVVSERGCNPLERMEGISVDSALQRIGLWHTNAQRILFGDVRYRVVKYDKKETPVSNETRLGLYGLLQPTFLLEAQNWSKTQQGIPMDPFPTKALREGLANAVAHAAYYDGQGDVIVELFSDRVSISNLCIKESGYFANKWFSRSHKTVNRMLMEALRLAGAVDELGRGKNLIFAESLRNGKNPPTVVLEKGGRYDRWRLYIYGGSQNRVQLRVLQRLREMYQDEQKALIANALVLWSGYPVSNIQKYVDGESSRIFADVLVDMKGPIFYYQKNDQIVLRRWVRVLLGEGKDSKQLSAAEEEDLFDLASKIQTDYHHGYITPKQLRELGAMGDTNSEIVQSSQILKKWMEQGQITKVKKGLYKFVPAKPTPDMAAIVKSLLEKFRSPSGSG